MDTQFLNQPAIQLFGIFPPDIVGVSDASAEVKEYLDIPL